MGRRSPRCALIPRNHLAIEATSKKPSSSDTTVSQPDELLPIPRGGRFAALPPDHGAAMHAQAARQVGIVGEGELGDVVALPDQRFIGSNASCHDATIMLRGLRGKGSGVDSRHAARSRHYRRAGPIGLACAISAKRRGIDPLVIDAGAVANSIVRYPINMTFFTTPERLEIGDHPWSAPAPRRRAKRR